MFFVRGRELIADLIGAHFLVPGALVGALVGAAQMKFLPNA